jgi:hypothetical protein
MMRVPSFRPLDKSIRNTGACRINGEHTVKSIAVFSTAFSPRTITRNAPAPNLFEERRHSCAVSQQPNDPTFRFECDVVRHTYSCAVVRQRNSLLARKRTAFPAQFHPEHGVTTRLTITDPSRSDAP